jgi:signal transduction histidine kinase
MVASRPVGGVRVRTTLAATLVVAVVLAAASVVFVLLQRNQLRASVTDLAIQQAGAVAHQIAVDGLAPAGGLVLPAGEQALLQVVDSNGRVTAASPSIDGEPPVLAARPAPGQVETLYVDHTPIGDDSYVAVAHGVRTPDGDAVVFAAQSLQSVDDATRVVTGLLLIGCPLVVLAVAAVSYWLTGRALAPVRALRIRVAEVSSSNLDDRLPVPPAGDEISKLAETMNAMLTRLRVAAETQRRFVADASHELRSPLSSIRAAHEVAAAHPKEVDWTSVSENVLAETARMERLVDDLLTLARVDEGGLSLELQDVDLDDVAAAEVARLRRQAGDLLVRSSLRPARVHGDRGRLAQLVRNLADNAARHASTSVSVDVWRENGAAKLAVADDGLGIAAQNRERVFERFVRLDESRGRTSGGAGLGLSIVREIATAHGGSVRLEEAAGGARFVLTLPLSPPLNRVVDGLDREDANRA